MFKICHNFKKITVCLLWAGMLPFLPGDAIKIAVTALLCPLLRKRIPGLG